MFRERKIGGSFPGSAFGTQAAPVFFDSPCEVVVPAQSLLTRRTRSDGVVNRTVTIDPQNAERVSFSVQQAADLHANRKGRKPNLRFRMGTRTDNRGS
jgi:hypothetical protein